MRIYRFLVVSLQHKMQSRMNGQTQNIPSVSYYALTDEQLRKLVSDGVIATLKEIGFSFDGSNKVYSPEKDDEARPVEYWIKKLHVNRATLWRRQKAGVLNPTYMGKKLFYRPSDIELMFDRLNSKSR